MGIVYLKEKNTVVKMVKSLLSLHPVSKEFHPTKNTSLRPEDFTIKSNKKVWWQCSVNSEHEWEASITNRTRAKSGCPYCSGRLSTKNNNLSLHSVVNEFNYEKNNPLKPEDFTINSGKKIWWKCSNNPEHEWEAVVNDRTRKDRQKGCPYCRGYYSSKENNLSLHPIAKEFHPTKNGNLKPEDFTIKSSKKVWWRCSKDPEHEWETIIANRTSPHNESGCPYCSGNLPSKDNNLSLHPIAKEFHYERNTPLKPEDFTLSSGKKIWWICDKGHEWEAVICNRNSKHNQNDCPFCGFAGTSKAEQEVLDYIKFIYDGEVIHRYRLDKMEADIYLPDKNLSIEFNGLYWHSELYKSNDYHYTKYKHFADKGIQLYYIWEDQWNFCREEVKENLRKLIFDNAKISFKQETFFYTDFRFVSKFRKDGMVEICGYGSWEIV